MTLSQDQRPSAEHLDFVAEFDALNQHAYRAATRVLGPGEDARDVAQETLARAYVRWDRLSEGCNTRAWVTRVSRNLAIDVLRRKRPNPEIQLVEPAPDDEVIERLEFARILDNLAPRQREALLLRYVEDQSVIDTANAMNISCSRVRKAAGRGRTILRRQLLAAGLVAILALVGATVALIHRAGRAVTQSVSVASSGRGFSIRISLSGARVVTGGRLAARVSVHNETDHPITLTGEGPNCAFAPIARFVTPAATPAVGCASPNGVAPITLAPGETRTFSVPVDAIDASGTPLAPGSYRVDFFGIAPGFTQLPDRVDVVAADHALGQSAAAPAGGRVSAGTATADRPNELPTTLLGANPPRSVSSPSPTGPPVTHAPVTLPPITSPAPPSDPPGAAPTPPAPTAMPFDFVVRTRAPSIGAQSEFTWRVQAKNKTRRSVFELIAYDTVTVQTPDGVVHRSARQKVNLGLHAGARQTAIRTIRGRFGAIPFIDGGLAGPNPKPGIYVLTYVFELLNGAKSPPVVFTLRIR